MARDLAGCGAGEELGQDGAHHGANSGGGQDDKREGQAEPGYGKEGGKRDLAMRAPLQRLLRDAQQSLDHHSQNGCLDAQECRLHQR